MSLGIDLSHHQDARTVPWSRMQGVVEFVICRAAYGAKLKDRQVVEHVARARAIGAKVGLYQFFRYGQDPRLHFATLRAVAEAVGLHDGDIVPAIDIERDPLPAPGRDVSPAWAGPAQELCELLREEYGDCIVYITQREWKMLGSPAWVLERPLWVAHYTAAAKPATPGGVEPVIWQYRVGPFDPKGPGGYDKQHPEFDHNRGLKPLPLVRSPDERIEEHLDRAQLDSGDHDVIGAELEQRAKAQVAESLDQMKRALFDEEPEKQS